MRMKKTLCLVLCLLLVFSLSGCRYSNVLEQIIHDQMKSHEIDKDTNINPKKNNEKNKDENDRLNDLKTSDQASNKNQEQQSNPTNGDQNNDTSSAKGIYNADAGASGTATTGTPSKVTGTGSGATASSTNTQGNNGTGSGGTGDNGTSYGNGGANTAKEVVDPNGQTVDIPEGVNHIAATGQAALAVLIVGGSKALTGTDAVTMSEASSAGLNLSNTTAYWQNNGSSPMSDTDFSALLAAKPDAVIETSGKGTVSESQAQQLTAAGIQYLAIPQMTSVDSIKQGMSAVAQMLKSGNSDAEKNADTYNNWLDSKYKEITSATSSHAESSTTDDWGDTVATNIGTYTLYLNGWDPTATFSIGNTNVSGTGAAYASNGATESTVGLTNFLSYANILNTSSKYGIAAQTLYVSPLLPDYSSLNITGTYATGYYRGSQKLLEQSGASLGTKNFPYVIVPDQATKSGIESDRDKGNSLWSIYPHINTGNGSFNSDGFQDNSGNIIRSQISGSYDVLINPKGLMSDWVSGGPEGILESLWAGWKYFNAISEDDLRKDISEFYSNFYGVSLSAGQIDQILAGGN